MSQHNYTLTHPFEYAHKGEMVPASFITLLAPTSKHACQCADLKQLLFQSFPKSEEVERETQDDSELEGHQILALLLNSKDVSLKKVILLCQELFTLKPSVALVDGETRLTKPLIEEMHPDDFEMMMGEYLARFIIASVWSILKVK